MRTIVLCQALLWSLTGYLFAQPKNPHIWLIADSNVVQFDQNYNTILKSKYSLLTHYIYTLGEVSASIQVNDSVSIFGNAFEIIVVDSMLNVKKKIKNFRINFNTQCCDDYGTQSITQGLLFLVNKDTLIVIWGAYEGGIGEPYGNHWGYTLYRVTDNDIQLVQAPKEIASTPNFEKCAAVRHANGRDWWVMFQNANGNFIRTLFNKYGLIYKDEITTLNQGVCCGLYPSQGQANFSSSGKWFASAQCSGQLHWFGFERHAGNLTKQNTMWLNLQLYGVAFLNDSILTYLEQRENPYNCTIASINLNNRKVDTLFNKIGMHYFSTLTQIPNGGILLPKFLTNQIHKITTSGIDTTFYTNLPYVVRGNPPNVPNYELGPDLNPGFTTSLTDTVLCVGQTFTVTDTSWGHFRRKWEWGDGTFSDTLPVKQHWELLGLTDTFRILSHTFSQPGTYNLTLHIINDSSEFGYMDSSVSKTYVVLPWCQSPQIQTHTDTTCLGQMALSASGDSANYLWTFTNGTAMGQTIVHSFNQSGWNYFTLKVSKLGVDTLLTDSVFVKDCIRANLITETIPFCDSVIVKVYPQIIQGQVDNATVTFQNQTVSCLDSCMFTSAPLSEQTEALEATFQNSTYDTTFSKSLVIKKLDCPEFIEIFPNPITNTLNIHYRLEQPENLRLCNAIGQDVLHLRLEGNGIYSVDVTTLARGFYHLRLEKHPDKKRGLRESWKLVLSP